DGGSTSTNTTTSSMGTGGNAGASTGGNVGTNSGGSGGGATTSNEGGTNGMPTIPCQVSLTGDITEPSNDVSGAIGFPPTTSYFWAVTWLEANGVWFQTMDVSGSPVGTPFPVASGAGTRTAPKLGVSGPRVAIAFGESNAGNTIGFHYLQVIEPSEEPLVGATEALGGTSAPVVGGIAGRGAAHEFLVAAIDSTGAGLLALFTN